MAYHHGNLREGLIAAASEQLRERGAAGVSLRGVARQEGVGVSASYHHFKNKQELLAAVAERGFLHLSLHLQRAAGDTAPDKLRDLGRRYLSFAEEDPHRYMLMFGATIEDMSEHDALQAASRVALHTVGVVIESCYLGAGLPPADLGDIRDIALRTWTMMHGLASLTVLKLGAGPPGFEREGRVERYIDIVVATIWPPQTETPPS